MVLQQLHAPYPRPVIKKFKKCLLKEYHGVRVIFTKTRKEHSYKLFQDIADIHKNTSTLTVDIKH